MALDPACCLADVIGSHATPAPWPMVDSLILLLFLISGAATGWLGVDLLPEKIGRAHV